MIMMRSTSIEPSTSAVSDVSATVAKRLQDSVALTNSSTEGHHGGSPSYQEATHGWEAAPECIE